MLINFYIYIDTLNNGQNGTGYYQNYSFIVPNNVNSGQIINYYSNGSFEQLFKVNNMIFDLVHLTIRDNNFNVINLNGADCSFVFMISEIIN